MRYRKTSALLIVPVIAVIATLVRVVASFQGAPRVPLAAPVPVPFDLVNHHIVIPVTVNGSQPLSFVFDTGDKYAVVDVQRARSMGLPAGQAIVVRGTSSTSATGMFLRESTYGLAALPGFSRPVTLAIPLAELAPRLGHDFDGLLGTDFVDAFVVEVDYAARRLVLHDRDSFAYSGGGAVLPVTFNAGGLPLVDASVTIAGRGEIRGRFLVDLGGGGTAILYAPFVREHDLPPSGTRTVREIAVAGVGGASTGRIGRIAALAFGGITLRDVPVAFAADETGARAGTDAIGSVAYQVMRRARIFLDYARHRIILEPGADISAPFRVPSSGLEIHGEGPDYRVFRVYDVLEDSPASDAGIEVGDIITAVDGREAASLTLTDLLELFEHEQARRVTLGRGPAVLRVTLTPRVVV